MSKKHRTKFSTSSVALYLIYLWAIALACILITQLLFAVINREYFNVSGSAEWMKISVGALRFALSISALTLMPIALVNCVPTRKQASGSTHTWQRGVTHILFSVGSFLLIVPNIADIPYYRWTYRRMTSDIFSYLHDNFKGQAAVLTGQFITDFWQYVLLFLILWIAAIWAATRATMAPPKRTVGHIAQFIIIGGALAVSLRGGIIHQTKPLRIIDAAQYTSGENTALVMNTPFSIYRTFGRKSALSIPNYFADDSTLTATFSPIIAPAQHPAPLRNTDGTLPNIVLIILESFGEEYVGSLSGQQSWTPFLDSLARHSLHYRGMANGKRSIESLPALLSGIPSLMNEAYITSTFSQNNILSLPEILRRHGYRTAFFHGAPTGSMNFDSYAHLVGITDYYGMEQYPYSDGYDGVWGIFDEPFLQFVANKIGEYDEPFFATLYTISSHHPYTIPQQYEGRFPKGPQPILETVGYSDNALRQFFATVAHKEWFPNTLFIITADHTSQPITAWYKNAVGQYAVPMLFYMPGGELPLPQDSTRIFQHCDLLPTLRDLLGFDECCLAFGSSAMQDSSGFHVAYTGSRYQLTRGNIVTTFDGEHWGRYTPDTDTLMLNNIFTTNGIDPSEDSDCLTLKAIIQQYNSRLIQNRLTCNER